ncbi:helix-turn-helix domain-containing protein [Streptomyces niveus]|uniref:nSTAND1 domain-containing NTPase n=1 Tax=Streptomyces niveus TaxID=193462 RepID=UPI0036370CB2
MTACLVVGLLEGAGVPGRREVPVDPGAGPVQRFAFELRKMRAETGVTYRVMAERAGYSITTLSQAAAGEQLPTLPVVLAYAAACGGDGTQWEARWREASGEAAALAPRDGGGATDPPYQGLARYETGDSGRFFGREQLTADLVDLLRRQRFVAVFGPSGIGKSSLLRAGLIPALQNTPEPDERLAAIRILTPGTSPLRDHAHLLIPSDTGTEADTLVIVDQFEEAFTLCHDPAERTRFFDLLLTARKPDSRLRVLITVRADFYGRCAEHRDLADALRDANILVGPMTPAELRDAIVKPATARGLTVERALTAQLVSEVTGAPGGLPLMSHVLLETWRRRRGGKLTLQEYESAGGLDTAIAKTAEDLYARLTPQQAELTLGILLRLITPGDGTPDTRRPIERTELDTLPHQQQTTHVIERLVHARLLTLDNGIVDLAHEALITAWPRLRRWIDDDRERLRAHRRLTEAAKTWADLGEDPGALYRGAPLTTAEKHFSNEHSGDLTTAEKSFLTASTNRHRRTTRLSRALTATLVVLALLASAAAITAYRQSTTAQAERNTAIFSQITAHADRLRGVQSSLAAQLDLTAYRMRPTSDLYTRLITDANSPLSTTLPGRMGNSALMQFSPNGRALLNADADGVVTRWKLTQSPRLKPKGKPLAGPQTGEVTAVAFGPDGRILANADGGGTVRLWNITDPRKPTRIGRPLTGHSNLLWSMEFSPDGRTLASSSHDSTVRLWDLSSPAHPSLIGKFKTEVVTELAFSPDGRILAAASEDGKVRLHSLTDPAHPTLSEIQTGHSDVVYSSTFSPDGNTLATASGDGTVRLWNLTEPAHPEAWGGLLDGHTKLVRSIAFSPDGRTLASASHDSTVRLWNTVNLASPTVLGQPLTDHTNIVSSVVFSPDGRTLATAGDDGQVRLWDLPSGVVSGHTLTVISAAFSSDGRIMASASYDGTVRLWNTSVPTRPEPLGKPLLSHASSVALSPDGRTMATGVYKSADSSTVQLWTIEKGTDPKPVGEPVAGHTGLIESVAFSPDGRTLATAGNDSTVRLWNVSDPARPRSLGKPLSAHNEVVNSAAFSPDGRTLATAGNDSTVRLWNVSDPARPRSLGKPLSAHNEVVYSAAFSPDGRTLATAANDSTVRLWNVTDPTHVEPLGSPLAGHTAAVRSVAFAPDGSTLASASHDSTVRLWNVTDPAHVEPLGSPLTGHTDAVRSVAFAPDGSTLASTSQDSTIRLWQLRADQASERICGTTKNALTPQRWEQYIPQLPFEPPCT